MMTVEDELRHAGTVVWTAPVPGAGPREAVIEALQGRDQADQAWLAYARKEAELGFAALDRGEGIRRPAGTSCTGGLVATSTIAFR
jgi:hypothetical protein